MSMFEKAARLRLRFETNKGEISTEDLFVLPLQSKNDRPNLDDIARALNAEIIDRGNVSFVTPTSGTDEVTQLKFDLVKHVIDVKLAENKAAVEARENAEKKRRIMDIIADKRDESLKGQPLEELEKMLASL